MRPSLWKFFWRDEEGQDLVEYALLLALLSLCALSLLMATKGSMNGLWDVINNGLSTTVQAAS